MASCPICHTPTRLRFPVALDPLTRDPFAVHACPRCHHGITQPVPQNLGAYYGNRYYGNRDSLPSRWCACRRTRVVSQSVHPRTPGRILDIGCGDGSFLLAARARGWQVYGTKLNLEGLRDPQLAVFSTIGEARQAAPSTASPSGIASSTSSTPAKLSTISAPCSRPTASS